MFVGLHDDVNLRLFTVGQSKLVMDVPYSGFKGIGVTSQHPTVDQYTVWCAAVVEGQKETIAEAVTIHPDRDFWFLLRHTEVLKDFVNNGKWFSFEVTLRLPEVRRVKGCIFLVI
jgi:hypothetical protein